MNPLSNFYILCSAVFKVLAFKDSSNIYTNLNFVQNLSLPIIGKWRFPVHCCVHIGTFSEN